MEKIKQFFLKNNLEYVIFDMDDTLVQTHAYYKKNMVRVIQKILKVIPTVKGQEYINTSNEIYSFARREYLKSSRPVPVLIKQRTRESVVKYFEENSIGYDKEKVDNIIDKSFNTFYTKSPTLYNTTLKTLHKINKVGIKMGVYSHAQYDWTEKKVERIKREYKRRYNRDIELPFYSTDINEVKDIAGWRKAGEYHKFVIDKTLVIGDSLTSDIYPAIEAGYRCLIYLIYSGSIPLIDKKARIYLSENIGTIFDTI